MGSGSVRDPQRAKKEEEHTLEWNTCASHDVGNFRNRQKFIISYFVSYVIT